MDAERLSHPRGRDDDGARAAAELAARASYGRLVAFLTSGSGDVLLAEDALGHAFEQALRRWPVDGVPDRPDAWLLSVARNRQRDDWKSARRRLSTPLDEAGEPAMTDHSEDFPDRRLALLLMCAHPAIAEDIRTPLMLQAVLGFDAAQIGAAFAVPTATMAQRLVRAKRRIRDARIPFEPPGPEALPDRLPPVLEAVYGCLAVRPSGPDDGPAPSLAEGLFLAELLASSLATDAEAWGLASMAAFLASRPATGPFVPLEEQDPQAWHPVLMRRGREYLERSSRLSAGGAPGRFQLEAAIQAAHADRARTGETPWTDLATLYAALNTVAPTLGSLVAEAAVLRRADGPHAALRRLDAVALQFPGAVERFQPLAAVRADALEAAGDADGAAEAWERALELSAEERVRAYLRRRLDLLRTDRLQTDEGRV
ncbi:MULTISPECIES: DUF6596 domain-containing protein [Arthrobacter]|uniref:DUF6596 domain-containing protein n=2 Tax=Arthrobacter TaxID=1663 RepID=A0ABU9KH97_9MICC|nr:DUF6596 domain-containing protein [Arthrobacter sp. YJM1]MDP5226269.1 sigma factor [Arthrobacter sp. YJM1]